jgi:hypothetical protein
MSFQAYLDTIEKKSGKTPRELLVIAHEKGLDAAGVKAGAVVEWFAEDYALGRGHAMAFWHVLTKGETIDAKFVGSDGVHRDASDTLWLDGIATKPAGH